MIKLESYLCGKYQSGTGEGAKLFDPTTGEVVANTSTEGLDMKAAVAYARDVGGPNLRALTFGERGAILKTLSKAIHAAREELIEVSIVNAGNTRSDAKFDIDGASGTLSAYAHYSKAIAEQKVLVEGEGEPLLRAARFCGYHVKTTRPGVAVHINAFNFPAWGMAEKMATAILAGVPVITKPATSTSLIAYRTVQKLVETGALPEGAFQFVCGSAGDLLDHLGPFDHMAFTGSAGVGLKLRSRENLLAAGTRVNVEADSLNSVVLAPDVDLSSDTYGAFLRHVEKELVQKAGQKCTATRRIFVPREQLDDVQAEIISMFEGLVTGNPRSEGVRVGPLTTESQLHDARDGIKKLVDAGANIVFGGKDISVEGCEKGYFLAPTLLRVDDMNAASAVHDLEVFAPVVTLIAYDDAEQAVVGVAKGGGSLVSTVYTDDKEGVSSIALAIAPYNGRVVIGSNKVADSMIHPGMVLPASIHGGPGRAGGGEELGGLRGLDFYMQRSAIQGDRGLLDRALGLR